MRTLKNSFFCLLLLALVATGWMLRGLMPGDHPAISMAKENPGGPGGPGAVPEVVTETVKELSLQPVMEYVGHVEALQDVEIYAQVEGKIQTVDFEEGSLVEKGALLYTIDQSLFRAKVDIAEATLSRAKSSLIGAQADLDASEANLKSVQANLTYAGQYFKRLATAGSGNVVLSELDKARSETQRYRATALQAQAQINQKRAQLQEMTAALRQAEADLEITRINIAYTEVRSPITGKIGRAEVACGDYVSPGNILLARVVQVNPVRVCFSISDRTYMDLRKETSPAGLPDIKAKLRLPNDETFPTEGTLDFVSNQMNVNTGTIPLFLRFENSAGVLVPGSYVTVLLEPSRERRGLVVPEEATMTDQHGEYVYVLIDGNVPEQRYLELGDQIDGHRVVTSGLQPGETIIVEGLQKIRPGRPVKPAGSGALPAREEPRS